jgi:hypothetical protein
MDEEHSATQVSWGARINTWVRHDARDCPDWFNRTHRERWVQKELIVWQVESQHVIRLSTTHALRLLKDLRNDDAWTEQGIVIGAPVTRFALDEPEQKGEPALWNPIRLSPSQTEAVLRLLERNQARLRKISEEEEKDAARALGRAFRLILNYDRRPKDKPDTHKD